MTLSQSMRRAVSAVLHSVEARPTLPQAVVDFLEFLNSGSRAAFGMGLSDDQAVLAILTEAWRTPDDGSIPANARVVLRTSGQEGRYRKSGFAGYSLITLENGAIELWPADELQPLADEVPDADMAKPRSRRGQLATTG